MLVTNCYKCYFCSNITFKAYFALTILKIFPKSITIQHYIFHHFLSIPLFAQPTKQSYLLNDHWTGVWPYLPHHKQHSRTFVMWYDYLLRQSTTITNQMDWLLSDSTNLSKWLLSPLISTTITIKGLLFDLITTYIKIYWYSLKSKAITALNLICMILSLIFLPHTAQIGTLQTSTVYHLWMY